MASSNVYKNSKHQTPSSREIPSIKHQARSAQLALKAIVCSFWMFGVSLELGSWSLEFGFLSGLAVPMQ